jgi:hypothetical protein
MGTSVKTTGRLPGYRRTVTVPPKYWWPAISAPAARFHPARHQIQAPASLALAHPPHINKINEMLNKMNVALDFLNRGWYTLVQGTNPAERSAGMAQTYDVEGTCPVCGDDMVVTRLSCGRCGSSLEGAFRVAGPAVVTGLPGTRAGVSGARGDESRFGRLARLDRAQLEFVEAFLRCRGIIKNVEDMLGISYPTVKARLANVLETMGMAPDEELPAPERRRVRREILADLAAGRITTDEAHRLLAHDHLALTGDGEDMN